jgi:hypothetical protein
MEEPRTWRKHTFRAAILANGIAGAIYIAMISREHQLGSWVYATHSNELDAWTFCGIAFCIIAIVLSLFGYSWRRFLSAAFPIFLMLVFFVGDLRE